jgi:hypothetical protein
MATESRAESKPTREDISSHVKEGGIHQGDHLPLQAEFMEAQDLELVPDYSSIPKKVRAEECNVSLTSFAF